jgi:hypothetical protein
VKHDSEKDRKDIHILVYCRMNIAGVYTMSVPIFSPTDRKREGPTKLYSISHSYLLVAGKIKTGIVVN